MQNIHPYGWDRHDRTYFLFSPERLYRRTDPPIPEPETKTTKAKYTSKKGKTQRRGGRTSKRRKIEESEEDDTAMGEADETMDEPKAEDETTMAHVEEAEDPTQLNTFGDYKLECIAITLDEYNEFLGTIEKSKDQNERNLKDRVKEEVLPALLRQEESRQRKIQERLRAVQMEQKMLGAKRSSRLQHKAEEKEKEAEEEKKKEELAAAHRWQREQEEVEHQRLNARRQRIETREERTKNREMERILREAELARDSEDEKKAEHDEGRESRVRKARMKETQRKLEAWTEDDTWYFDCAKCGQYGQNKDDGEHSISCEKCNVWQHTKCLGYSEKEVEDKNFHFICQDCELKEEQKKADEEKARRRKEDEAQRPRISLKFKVGPSSSPPQPKSASPELVKQRMVSVDLPPTNLPRGIPENGYAYAQPNGQPPQSLPPHYNTPQHSNTASMMHANARQQPYSHGHQPYSHPGTAPPAQHTSMNAAPQHIQTPAQYQAQAIMSSPRTVHSPTNHAQSNGYIPSRQRIPSPVFNKPEMSPTQGNPDVGPIAGFPGSSPPLQHASLATPYLNGTGGEYIPIQNSGSRSASFSNPQPQPTSGLSPVKQRTSISSLPQPSLVPQKSGAYQTPSSSFNNNQNMRSVSGTPIFPPAENLAPSPYQLNRQPVPTPSKHSPPSTQEPTSSQSLGDSNAAGSVQNTISTQMHAADGMNGSSQ